MGRTIGQIVESGRFKIGERRGPLDFHTTVIPKERLVSCLAAWRIQAETTSDDDERARAVLRNRIGISKLARYLHSDEKARELIKEARIRMNCP